MTAMHEWGPRKVAGVALLMGVTAVGCTGDCSASACAPSLELRLQSPVVAPAEVRFDVIADEVPLVCVLVLLDGGGVNFTEACPGFGLIVEQAEGSEGEQRIDGVYVPLASTVSVTLTIDGESVVQDAFVPEVVREESSEPGCDPCPAALRVLEN